MVETSGITYYGNKTHIIWYPAMDSKQELYISELPLTTTYVVNPIETEGLHVHRYGTLETKVATLQDIDTVLPK